MTAIFNVNRGTATDRTCVRFVLGSNITQTNIWGLRLLNPQSTTEWVATADPLIYGLELNVGYNKSLPAGVRSPTIIGVKVRYNDQNCVGGTVQNRALDSWFEFKQPNDAADQTSIGLETVYSASQNNANKAGMIDAEYIMNAGVVMVNPVMSLYYSRYGINNTATITNILSSTYFDGAFTKGTIGNIYVHYMNWDTDSTPTTGNVAGLYCDWNITAFTSVTGYSAIVSADINAHNKTFTIYGSRIYFIGTIGGGGVWKGHYLNATGVTCGGGQSFYGIDIDMSTMGVGGTINGIRCRVPNLIPAMVLGDGVGTLTVNFGAGNHPNIDSSTGRVYFGTQAGGSAAADDIYCHNVLQTAPWAENTWDELNDLGLLREINMAISQRREPSLPQAFVAKFNSEGYYNRLQMDALERGAILKLEDQIKELEEEVRWLKTRNN